MKVKQTLNKASLPRAIEEQVKRGYSEEDAERILTQYVERRFETDRDFGDKHEDKEVESFSQEEMQRLGLEEGRMDSLST